MHPSENLLLVLETQYLRLRQWQDADYPIYAQINADPLAMRYFPATLTAAQSYELADKLRSIIEKQHWGVWAVELKAIDKFIGMVGLAARNKDSALPHAPLVEMVWRIAPAHWNNGYASEAARRALQFAFEELKLKCVYAYTAKINTASQRVMVKIGMENTGEEFNHPKLENSHVLAKHCLYRITKERWRELFKIQ
jgi:RimJ/RimL family protein N-acetyltransferase